ncbi:MAG: DUF547 domain-containing protein [Saprospiraceae bacterium]|nr:DUF547 domain-containing protein [Candidatus Opimibacter skivensis]
MLLISYLVAFLISMGGDEMQSSSIACLPLPDHSVWSAELKKYVSADGKVNYRDWANNQAALDGYLAQLAGTQPLSNWSTNVQLAYWINVYNAYTVKLVLQHYPVQTIKDIYQGNPWDKAWITLDGKTYSLNQIENEYIRQRFRDPRIHFALNCGALSCPPLLNEAYDPARLDAQLTSRTKAFIADQYQNQTAASTVRLSQLFVWYKDDFKPDVISFLNTYLATPIPAEAKIEFVEYDWSLNEK